MSSTVTGKEKIYLNKLLVSEQRSFSRENTHQFEDDGGNSYKVKFAKL